MTDEDVEAFEEAGIRLCGGVFSGDAGSFRGKVYDRLVDEVTGVSLYQDWIAPKTVCEMWRALEACDAEEAARSGSAGYAVAPEEVVHLRTFFRICTERGLGLMAWS